MKGSFLFLFLFSVQLFAQNNLITNIENRNTFSLNGKWNYIIDPYEVGYFDYRYKAFDEDPNTDPAYSAFYADSKATAKSDRIEYNFDLSPTLFVPGDWNTQDDKLLYYEGTIWYRKKFDYQKKKATNRVFLYIGAANYESHTYVNGKKVMAHSGGFTPFNGEITTLLKETDNSIVIKVDNKRKREAVPTLNTDWHNYGGLTRDVKLVEVPAVFIQDYMVQLKRGSSDIIKGFVLLNGELKNQAITIAIPEIKFFKTFQGNESGKIEFEFAVKGITYWSPENPKLYDVIISSGEDKVADKIGFRTLETKGTEILLNKKPVFLRGICIHEENPLRGGRAYSREDAYMLLNWAKELKCNFVRLAHYPHNENMVRVADELGIMVWSEIPVYWTIEWENPVTLSLAKSQLTDMITRDKNRASVIIWSMANETPLSDDRDKFLIALSVTARSLDSTRFISAAMEKVAEKNNPLVQIVEDKFAAYCDVVSFNQYVGWYDGLPDKCDKVSWKIPYNKPVIVSEFGGDALGGYFGDSLTRWTEDYQQYLYERTIAMLKRIPQLRGVTPWILTDFRSPRRLLPGIQDGYNRKGLISQNGDKKKAFFVLRNYYIEMEQKFK